MKRDSKSNEARMPLGPKTLRICRKSPVELMTYLADIKGGDNTIELFGNVIDRCRYLGDYGEEGVEDFMDFYSAVYVPRGEFGSDWFESFILVLFIDLGY